MRVCLVDPGMYGMPESPENPIHIPLHHLAKALVDLGHEVDVFCSPAPARGRQAYSIREVGPRPAKLRNALALISDTVRYNFAALRAVRRRHKYAPYDIIVPLSTPFAFLAFMLQSHRSLPPFVFEHGGPVEGLERSVGGSGTKAAGFFPVNWHVPKLAVWVSLVLLSYVLRRASRVIAMCSTIKEVIVEVFGLDPRKVDVIYNGVDTDLFRPGVSCSEIREKHCLADHLVVGCVARIAPYKNQISLVKAIPLIVQKYPGVRFIFDSPTVHPPYYRKVQELVRSLGVAENVIFLVNEPHHDHLPQYYGVFDVFVLLSTGDGLATTLLEAMACGKPFVVSDIPQNREVSKTGDEGDFVDPRDERSTADAIVRLLGDPVLRATRGQRARETALRYFDWRVIAAEKARVFQAVVQERARRELESSPGRTIGG
jgi:glycosyltransferase involved in cell wall biosynthesis